MYNDRNPWMRLKSYPEGKRIYGRDKEIEDLSQRIIYNSQTVIYGRSGIGKSSILKAGIFPILRKNNFFPVYIRFVQDDQDSYTQQIIDAVLVSLKSLRIEDIGAPEDSMVKFIEGYIEEVVPKFDQFSIESLWEFFHRHKFYYKVEENGVPVQVAPVLIFDQFEEIFTSEKNNDKVIGLFSELASLINNICPQHLLSSTVVVDDTPDVINNTSLIKKGLVRKSVKYDYIDETNLRIVLSMREDYLSYLERNITHIPSLKNNRYCLLPLSEDTAIDIIMKPEPGLVSMDVAKSIICKVTGAELQDFEIDDNPELEVDPAILSLYLSELYDKRGENNNQISAYLVENSGADIILKFYEKTISAISSDSIAFLEKRLVTKEKRRDSIYIDQALRHGVKRDEIDYLVDQRLLHEYAWRDGKRIEFVHDVLCPIIYDRMEEREKAEEQRKRDKLLIQAQQEKKRLRRVLLGTLFTLLFCSFLIWDGLFDEKKILYREIIKKESWMAGLDKMSAKDAEALPFHYVFYKKGRWAEHPFMIEARNGYGELTSEHGMSTYLVNHFDDTDKSADKDIVERLRTVVKWELLRDADGDFCVQERAFDKDGKVIFCYNKSKTEKPSIFISTYVDEMGFPIMMRDSCYIYLRTTMDENGYEVLQEFYDDKGFPVTNKDGAFKTRRTYSSNGIQRAEESLFIDGTPVIDRFGNCGWVNLETTEDGIHPTMTLFFDNQYDPCRVKPSNTMVKKYAYDEYGRLVSESYWKLSDSTSYNAFFIRKAIREGLIKLVPDIDNLGVHAYIQEYNEYGKCVRFFAFDKNGELHKPDDRNYSEIRRDFDDSGNLIMENTYDNNKAVSVYLRKFKGDECVNIVHYDIVSDNDSLLNNSYEWNDDKKRFVEINFYRDANYYSYSEYDSCKQKTLLEWYRISDGMPDVDLYGRHRLTIDYEYNPEKHILKVTERYFNHEGIPCGYKGKNSFHKEIMTIDSIAKTKTIIRMSSPKIFSSGLDESNNMDEVFFIGIMQHYDDNFEVIIAESSVDPAGVKRRTYENSAFYYTMHRVVSLCKSQGNQDIGYYAINEFGDLSLVRYRGDVFSAKIRDIYYDSNGKPIDVDKDDDYALIAAIDAPEGLGFRFGDIVVQQNDFTLWRYSFGVFDLSGLQLELDCNISHTFKVMRYNENKNDYELVEIQTEPGDKRVLDITYDKYYITDKEGARIVQFLRNNLFPDVFEIHPMEGDALYERGYREPMTVVKFNDWDMREHFNGEKSLLMERWDAENVRHIDMALYDEKNNEIIQLSLNVESLNFNIESYSTRPRYFNKIYEKYLETVPDVH